MAARAEFKIPNFEKCDVTMTITMSVAEWRLVYRKLNADNSNGEWYFKNGITKMLEQFEQTFHFYEANTSS